MQEQLKFRDNKISELDLALETSGLKLQNERSELEIQNEENKIINSDLKE